MTFREYYRYYLALHNNRTCRRLHVLGQIATLTTLFYAVASETWLLLFVVPFVVYPFAWSGHFFFEKNKPAAFSRPLWAKACDWIMLKDWILGRIER
jgi:hypothetical protein